MTNARIKNKWVKRKEKLCVISIKVMVQKLDDLLTHCKLIIKQMCHGDRMTNEKLLDIWRRSSAGQCVEDSSDVMDMYDASRHQDQSVRQETGQ